MMMIIIKMKKMRAVFKDNDIIFRISSAIIQF